MYQRISRCIFADRYKWSRTTRRSIQKKQKRP
nr:MAG TPA: hypothetical protein [Bacteriophage sp.]